MKTTHHEEIRGKRNYCKQKATKCSQPLFTDFSTVGCEHFRALSEIKQ